MEGLEVVGVVVILRLAYGALCRRRGRCTNEGFLSCRARFFGDGLDGRGDLYKKDGRTFLFGGVLCRSSSSSSSVSHTSIAVNLLGPFVLIQLRLKFLLLFPNTANSFDYPANTNISKAQILKESKMSKVLVTGANGFVAATIIDQLIAQGHTVTGCKFTCHFLLLPSF